MTGKYAEKRSCRSELGKKRGEHPNLDLLSQKLVLRKFMSTHLWINKMINKLNKTIQQAPLVGRLDNTIHWISVRWIV